MPHGLVINILHGKVLLDGQPVSDQQVIMLSSEMDEFYCSASTAIDGSYEIEIPSWCTARSVVLVSKIQGPVVALDYRIIPAEASAMQHDFNFDTADGSFNILHGEILTANTAFPPFVKINITPVHLNSIPAVLEQFFLRREKTIVDGSYFEEKISEDRFDIKLQRGTYRLTASYLVYKGPDSKMDTLSNYIVENMLVNGEAIPHPKEKLGGFIISIAKDSSVKIFLKTITGTEIYSSEQ